MDQLILASAVFLATHFVPSTPLRPVLTRAMGERPYLGLYTLVSFATIGWMIWAYNRAPVEPLFAGIRSLPAIVMPFALMLLAGGLLTRNPTLVGAQGLLKKEEPARAMLRITRHPVMWGFLLWALAHVLAGGDLKSLVFFGSFAVLAGLGTLLMDRRKAALGEDWARFARATSNVPFVAILQGRQRLDLKEIGWRNPAVGIVLFALFFSLHSILFGAQPW